MNGKKQESPLNILLIQIMRIGDAVQMIPIVHGLKALFPQSRIHVLTSLLGRKVFEMEPSVEGVHVLDKQSIRDLVCRSRKMDILEALEGSRQALHPLLESHWDWVINFSFSYPSALLAFLTGCERCSGFVITRQRRYLSKERWFAHSLASFAKRRYSNFNWVDINKEILSLPSVPCFPLLEPAPEASRSVSHRLQSMGLGGKRIIALHPGASGEHKRWPLEKFAQLGRHLLSREGHAVLVLGDRSEKDIGERLEALIGPGARSLAGHTSLEELVACLGQSSLLVSNDSGPMHLAASVGTPVVSLFFSTHFMETGPYGAGHFVLHPDLPCFPCQGTAKCPSRDCLGYIDPQTVAKLILGQHETEADWMGKDRGRVRAYRSFFDPWGFLDWGPVGSGLIRFSDLERILLRLSWLSMNGILAENDPAVSGYIEGSVGTFGSPENDSELMMELDKLCLGLRDLRRMLAEAGSVIVQMQGELVQAKPRLELVEDFGRGLARLDRQIASLGRTGSSLGFLGELLAQLSQSADAMNLFDLSIATGAIYGDMLQFTDEMLHYSCSLRECFEPTCRPIKDPGWMRRSCG